MAALTTPGGGVLRVGDPARRIVIAIDGPAASGKSSTAQQVADALGYRHVDSGALYRAAAGLRLRAGGDPRQWTEASVVDLVRNVAMAPTPHAVVPVSVGSEMSEEDLRGADVTAVVSRVARMPAVRVWVNAHVRSAATLYDVVVDGRDIGTAVFPDADLKIFLVADPWERARRRLMQRGAGPVTDAEIAAETDRLVHRDARDAMQTVQAKDAVLVDTTYLTQPQQVDRIVALARAVTRRPTETSPVDEADESR